MKKRSRRHRTEDEATPSGTPEAAELTHPGRGLEVAGIAMMIAAAALCFALFSFDPADGTGQGNLVGPAGLFLANALLGAIGVVGYVAAIALALIAGAVIVGRVVRPSIITVVSALAVTLSGSILAHLLAREPVLGHPAGGAAGALAGELLRTFAGSAGAALFAVGLFAVGIIGVTDVSFGAALRDGLGALRWIARWVSGTIEAERAAREAAKQREAELVEAERSRRAQAKLEADDRARRLEEELEEKKRLAVLRATAKAEERALQKIAALEAKERIEREQREADERAEAEAEAQEAAELAAAETAAPAISEVPSLARGQSETRLAQGASLGEEEVPPEEVALDIPGPGAEPEIVIADTHLDDAADVLESIAQQPSTPPRRSGPATRGALDRLLSGRRDEVDDEVEEEDPEDEADLEAEDEPFDGEDGGIKVYERKKIETDLAELEGSGEQAPALPPGPKPEKRDYQMPHIQLLDYEGKPPAPVDGEALRMKATRLEEKLKTYGVEGRVTAIRPGPVVTTYEYQPAPGVKVAKIANLSDDIAMSMEAMRVRIVAPIPGRGVVGIELPNEVRESVYLKELIAHDSFKKSKSLLTLALGKDAEGEPQVRDLRSMPHFLVAGTTGSGKSVSVNAMILSILYKATPDQVKFIMVDPKMLELSLYEDIPHLLLPVVTDPRKASLALQWAVDEMERRYQMLSDLKVRDLDGFNKKLARLAEQRASMPASTSEDGEVSERPEHHEKDKIRDPWPNKELPDPLPYIVVLIDEFADLMCVAPRDVEASVQRLAQKARAAGIHVMLATQRPSTDVITGVIKNNFPSRISFRVASRHDSATILNAPGAENLLGMGDMLCLGVTSPAPVRIHGAFVSEEEVQRVVDFWKAQAKPSYDRTILERRGDDEDGAGDEPIEHDEMYDRAVQIVTETRKASISAIQRRLRVGYNRAARMIEMMEVEGIVGPAVGPKGEREVLVRAIAADGSEG